MNGEERVPNGLVISIEQVILVGHVDLEAVGLHGFGLRRRGREFL